MARTVIAIDLTGNTPALLLGKSSFGKIKYTQLQLDDITKDKKLIPRSLIVSFIPCNYSFTRWLHVPFKNWRKVIKVLPSLLDVELPFSIDDTVYSFPAFKHSGRSTQVLAAGALKKDIVAILEKFAEYHLKPDIIDHQGLALWSQSIKELPPEQIGNSVLRILIYLANNASAIVIGQGNDFISSHALNQQNPSEIRRIVNSTLSSVPENTTQKVPSATSLHDKLQSRVVWVWCGETILDKHKLSALQHVMNTIKEGEHILHDNPKEFLLRGLISRALTSEKNMCDLSLDAESKLLRRTRILSLCSAGSLLLSGLLLIATGFFIRSVADSKTRQLNADFSQLARELGSAEGTTGADAVLTASRTANSKIEALRPFTEYFKPSMIDEIYQLIHIARTNNLHYESLYVNNSAIEISGTAENWDSPEVLSAHFIRKGIKPTLNRKDALPDEKIPFTISWSSRK
jgi:hypothetical protein